MKRVLLDMNEGLIRTALVEDGKLIELYYETEEDASLVGNVYAGRVEQVVPNLQACFVDIGMPKRGYLYYGEKRAVSDKIKTPFKPKAGDTIIVQVEKDAVGEKGAVLNRKVSLPGKFLVFLPDEPGEIRISRKITNEEVRKRIRSYMEEILPHTFGVIVRTNACDKEKNAFQKELDSLMERYKAIAFGTFQKAPSLLYQEAQGAGKAIRDFYASDLDEVVVNDETVYEQLLSGGDFDHMGHPRLILHKENMPLFDTYYIESQSQKALERKVWLKSGGFLVIEETEACAVIDVNSGKSAGRGDLEKNIVKTNLEAAKEVAKQIRLRNLSGIIIVDFIDMHDMESRGVLTKLLEEEVQKDRVKTVVVGMTALGLMQITRKKTKPSLARQMTTKCRSCEGSGYLPSIEWTVVKMRKEVELAFANTIYNHIVVEADERLIYAFRGGGERKYINKLKLQFDAEVVCRGRGDMGFGKYEIHKTKI